MSAKNPRKPPHIEPSPAEGPSGGFSPADEALEEVRALYAEILPADVAADWDLATTLYLETHPLMRERLQVIRAREIDKSGEVSTAKADETTQAKRSGRR